MLSLNVIPTLALSGLVLFAACSSTPESDGAAGASAARSAAGGWEDLNDLSRWRGFRRDDAPASWSVQDGVIAFSPSQDRSQRGDLITRQQYGDFELQLEWKVSPGGNSGIIYRSTEEEDTPWKTGPEMQVLDDARHADGQIPSHRAGALYDLIVPPENIARPVGEWNQVRLVVRGNHIQQYLNGHETADIVVGSDEWKERFGKSKFRDLPHFGTRPSGHIVLQDHNDPVWFRNVRVRRLD